MYEYDEKLIGFQKFCCGYVGVQISNPYEVPKGSGVVHFNLFSQLTESEVKWLLDNQNPPKNRRFFLPPSRITSKGELCLKKNN